MNITSVTYLRDDDGNIDMIDAVIDGKHWGVPISDTNRHYVAIKEWLDAGNSATNYITKNEH